MIAIKMRLGDSLGRSLPCEAYHKGCFRVKVRVRVRQMRWRREGPGGQGRFAQWGWRSPARMVHGAARWTGYRGRHLILVLGKQQQYMFIFFTV